MPVLDGISDQTYFVSYALSGQLFNDWMLLFTVEFDSRQQAGRRAPLRDDL